MLSVGTVGVGNSRRLVPTRWSITATDDMIGKRLAASVKDFNWCADHLLYFGGYLGNYFIVMLFPDAWGYELFESLEGHGSFTTDFEGHAGRSGYASETAGGYYAARLAVLEKLSRMKLSGVCSCFKDNNRRVHGASRGVGRQAGCKKGHLLKASLLFIKGGDARACRCSCSGEVRPPHPANA